MAHNLATINGTHAFAYLDQPGWHNLGNGMSHVRDLTRDAMIDAALDAAQLRWQVASQPIHLADGTEIPGHKASVRLAADGSVAATLGIVGDGYTHVQNERAVDILRVLVEQFGWVPATAGALGQGERCWMLLRMADAKVTPVDGDDVNGYALLQWGHDGNISITLLGTTIRVVCQNTLNAATNGRRAWITIRHTASADARVDQAAKIVEQLALALNETGDTFAKLARKRLGPQQLAAYIARVIPNTTTGPKVSKVIEARRDTVALLVHGGRGAALANQLVDTSDGGASVWAAVNAVSEYFDHVRPGEAQSESGLKRAYESAIFGGNAEIKTAALAAAQALLVA